MSTVTVVQGFSLINRLLLYASVLLAPAQFVSGLKNNCPSNIGFLAYNVYNQIVWYQAVKAKELHALALILPHFNLIYALSYLGGISSGNITMGGALGLGTMAVLGLNTAVSWISWMTNQPEGFYKYRFFFFGWRTLKPTWHKFFLVWEIADTLAAFSLGITALFGGFMIPADDICGDGDDDDKSPWSRWLCTLAAIPIGAAVMLLYSWPNILWTELVVSSNNIESPTDWIAVWLFVAQTVAMIIPPCTAWLGCFRSG
jgi:hypothetical protein